MSFTPPLQFPKAPKVDEGIKKVDKDNPKIKKYTDKYQKADEEKRLQAENHLEEMMENEAKEKDVKKAEFFLQLLNAVIAAVIAGIILLIIEHFFGIVGFVQNLFSSS